MDERTIKEETMTPKEKSEELVHHYRMLLMNEDTECGEEILVSKLSKQCALIASNEVLKNLSLLDHHPLGSYKNPKFEFWYKVKEEIEKL